MGLSCTVIAHTVGLKRWGGCGGEGEAPPPSPHPQLAAQPECLRKSFCNEYFSIFLTCSSVK